MAVMGCRMGCRGVGVAGLSWRRLRLVAGALVLVCMQGAADAFISSGPAVCGSMGTTDALRNICAHLRHANSGIPSSEAGLSAKRGSTRARNGAHGLRAVGGGAELKSLLRKFGLTAVTFHAMQWTVWMAIGYTALSYVNIAELVDVLPGRLLEAVEVCRIKVMGTCTPASSLQEFMTGSATDGRAPRTHRSWGVLRSCRLLLR